MCVFLVQRSRGRLGNSVARVTIIGAGDMGTALVTPLHHNQHEIVLAGTVRDDAIVRTLQAGEPHPRLGVPVPGGVRVVASDETEAALSGADIVVLAITSNAVRLVLEHLQPVFGQPKVVITVAKGFDTGSASGEIRLLPETIANFSASPVVAVGGPSKANEVASGTPTSVVFGSPHSAALAYAQRCFAAPAYHVHPTADIVGLEVAAAMKNAYAIALGIPDGLEQRFGRPFHNLRAALFPLAVHEMCVLASLLGGQPETVRGLAGAGDLLVTITSGRNRLLGERIGLGQPAADAIADLTASDTTVEGYPAVALSHRLAESSIAAGHIATGDLSLLDATWRILYQNADAEAALLRVV